jgi:LacI family transcriptional regulator
MRTLLKRRVDFDSIFAINDSMAFGALEVLADSKIEVPKQIAIVGFDGVQSENSFSQDLTTVSIDIQTICNLLVDKLGKVLSGKSLKSELVPALLLARETA